MKYIYLILFVLICFPAFSQIQVKNEAHTGYFSLVSEKVAAPVVVDTHEKIEVKKAASLFSGDIKKVTGTKPEILDSVHPQNKFIVLVGTISHSSLINELIREGKIDVSSIRGLWETSLTTVVEDPFPGVQMALVIAGSDPRGAAYGMLELSKKIGVSPWYWWADVPTEKHDKLYISPESFQLGPPDVKYRGIFINDEDWGLHPWAKNNFEPESGGIGPKTYSKVCELLMRLKANHLWPAMHKCTPPFYSLEGNKRVADSFGIVVGTSHCEPLLFNNNSEWDSETMGEWNYHTNRDTIYNVLDQRVKEASRFENIYTLGIRGIHDEEMEVDLGLDERVNLLEKVFSDQRKILKNHIDKKKNEIPQVFVPYKEVLKLYNNGLDVPEDVTLMWVDDNYGYIRRLSTPGERKRSGGSGVYYHFSYVGNPQEYLWLCSTPPALVYEEMKKAYEYDARRIWMFNAGDIKPAEYLTQFSLELGWNTDTVDYQNVYDHLSQWLGNIFGDSLRAPLTDIMKEYYQLGFIRKPEFTASNKVWIHEDQYHARYSDLNFTISEIEDRINRYKRLGKKTMDIYQNLPARFKPAFYELIAYPVLASSMQNQKTLLAQKNRMYAREKRATANMLIPQIKQCHDSIDSLTRTYNSLLNGKWKGMMSVEQHPLSAYYQLPDYDSLTLPEKAIPNVSVEGNNPSFQFDSDNHSLRFTTLYPEKKYIELYNNGKKAFDWQAEANQPWIQLEETKGEATYQDRIFVSVDTSGLPSGIHHSGDINIKAGTSDFTVHVHAFHPAMNEELQEGSFFVEKNGYISIPAENYHRKVQKDAVKWQTIHNLGYTGASIISTPLVDENHNPFLTDNPRLEYDFYTFSSGVIEISFYVLPTFPINEEHEAVFNASVDDGHAKAHYMKPSAPHGYYWQQGVLKNVRTYTSKYYIDNPGKHTLNLWLAETGVVLDKFVIDLGGVKSSYTGPSETMP